MTIRNAASSLKKIRFLKEYSLWGFKTIAGAAYSFEVAGILRVGLDFFTDAANVDVDRARSDVGSVAPDGIEKMIAGENASQMACEIIEQTEFRGRGGDGLSANRENHCGGIDSDVSNFERTGRKRALEAAQHGFDTGDEFARAERLRDVVVRSDLETKHTIRLAAFCREKNHRHGGETGSLADGAAEFESIFAGNHYIEHEERGALALGIGDDRGTVGIDTHGKTVVLQMVANEAGNIGIVFNDEDAWFHGFIVAKSVPGT